jgi:outer membrane lipopolysaccharide assembly protein LptE/RlpB
LATDDGRTREHHLVQAYEFVARLHNAPCVTERVPEVTASFHERPFMVIHADRFASAAERAITDATVRQLPRRVGSVNRWVDATDVLERPAVLQRLRAAYDRT